MIYMRLGRGATFLRSLVAPDASSASNKERGGIMGLKTLRRVLLTAGAGAMLVAMTAVVPAAATPPSPLAGYASGTYITIDYPGAVQTDISGINNLGTMVGFYIDSGGVYHGFIYQRGTFTPFNDPSAGARPTTRANDSR